MLFLKASRVFLSTSTKVRCISTSICQRAIKTVQEKVDPYSKIHINCAYELKIVPYDLLECPDSNLLKATVNGDIAVKVSDKVITITGDASSVGTECVLEIPIKADLQIRNRGNTSLSDLYSDEIVVEGTGNIETKSLRSTIVDLSSTAGGISCRGITLAEHVVAKTSGKGNIFLDKLQGGSINASTESGNISVNASYSNKSTFQTTDGDLELKSIHKDCTVTSAGGKSLTMNGFYGTLNAKIGSESVQLQLSEMVGKSTITTTASTKNMQLNLADTVYETSSITVNSPNLSLDSSVEDKAHHRDGSSTKFGTPEAENTLHVETNSSVVLRKMSWADSFSFAAKMEQ